MVTRTQNRPLLLARAIESVLGQTMSDFHMVIVNDGGEPGAVDDVVAKYSAQADGRISVLHRPASTGMEAASNAGLRATSSRYIAILDDDDTWDRTFLQETVGTAETLDAMGVVTDTTVVLETVVGSEIRSLESFPFDPTPGPWMAPRPPNNLFRLLSWNQFPPCAFIYRRSVLEDIGYYDESLPVLGDWDFNLRFVRHHRIEHLPLALANYHHRPNDASSNSVHAGETLHEQVRLDLLDRYLHRDLQQGSLGVGFASNALYEARQVVTAVDRRLGALDGKLDELRSALVETIGRLDHLTGVRHVDPSPASTRAAATSKRSAWSRIRSLVRTAQN